MAVGSGIASITPSVAIVCRRSGGCSELRSCASPAKTKNVAEMAGEARFSREMAAARGLSDNLIRKQ